MRLPGHYSMRYRAAQPPIPAGRPGLNSGLDGALPEFVPEMSGGAGEDGSHPACAGSVTSQVGKRRRLRNRAEAGADRRHRQDHEGLRLRPAVHRHEAQLHVDRHRGPDHRRGPGCRHRADRPGAGIRALSRGPVAPATPAKATRAGARSLSKRVRSPPSTRYRGSAPRSGSGGRRGRARSP